MTINECLEEFKTIKYPDVIFRERIFDLKEKTSKYRIVDSCNDLLNANFWIINKTTKRRTFASITKTEDAFVRYLIKCQNDNKEIIPYLWTFAFLRQYEVKNKNEYDDVIKKLKSEGIMFHYRGSSFFRIEDSINEQISELIEKERLKDALDMFIEAIQEHRFVIENIIIKNGTAEDQFRMILSGEKFKEI